ncbi:MAG: hypothetical protein HQL95_10340 [Magnetococcales bacterium]|nr:hypothetical protein [Magnetococcales bacterium]
MYRKVIFDEFKWDMIQRQGHAEGRVFLMLAEELQALWEEQAEHLNARDEAEEEAGQQKREMENLQQERDDLFNENEGLQAQNTELTNQLDDSTGIIRSMMREQNEQEEAMAALRLQLEDAQAERERLLSTIAAMELKEMLL